MSAELDRLAAACLFPGFVGLGPPDWIRRRLQAGLGGVVLFARNIGDRGQLEALIAALRAERDDALVAVDEEGGDVTRLEAEDGSSYPGNYALGALDDVRLTEDVAAAIAGDLVGVGITVDLAPVADVNANPRNPIVGVRSFGSQPELVARHVAAFVTGLQRAGVVACAKHFPGHGGTPEDSHLEVAVLDVERDVLFAEALPPFSAAINAGVHAIMTGHILIPALDEAPASLSPVLGELLRRELGFDGVVMTDGLEMRAVSATVGVEEGAVRALAAGADALCLGAQLGDAAVERIQRSIVKAVESGRLDVERLGEAAGRLLALVGWARDARDGARVDRAVGAAAARRALRAEGSVELTRPPLVVELVPEPSMAAGAAGHGLGKVLQARLPSTDVIRLQHWRVEAARVARERGGSQCVLVLRDAHRHEWQREVTEAVLAESADTVVVETGVPAWRPQRAAGYVVTHGAGRVNLEAAADLLLARR